MSNITVLLVDDHNNSEPYETAKKLAGDRAEERELELARHKQEMELAPLETRLIPVSYASAEELQARARDLLSPRGSIATCRSFLVRYSAVSSARRSSSSTRRMRVFIRQS